MLGLRRRRASHAGREVLDAPLGLDPLPLGVGQRLVREDRGRIRQGARPDETNWRRCCASLVGCGPARRGDRRARCRTWDRSAQVRGRECMVVFQRQIVYNPS